MDKIQEKNRLWDILKKSSIILGSIAALFAVIEGVVLFSNLFAKVSATVKISEYNLPFEVKYLVERLHTPWFDTIIKASLPTGKLSDLELMKTEIVLRENMKLNYLNSFNNMINYANILTLKNRGKKEIKDLKISSESIYGNYQYIDNDKNSEWDIFDSSHPIIVKKLDGKSSIIITIFSHREVISRKDITISNTENVFYPKRIYDIKGFFGAIMSIETWEKVLYLLMIVCIIGLISITWRSK
jgi:hypothetical protein